MMDENDDDDERIQLNDITNNSEKEKQLKMKR